MSRILVLGAGMMGAAITVPAAENAHSIALVGTPYDTGTIRSVLASGWHPGLETQLSERVEPFECETVPHGLGAGADLVVAAVTSAGLAWACDWIVSHCPQPVPVILVAKGVSVSDGRIVPLSDHAGTLLKDAGGTGHPVVAIAGPCIARDLANKHHTSVILASRDLASAEATRSALATPYYHLGIEPDVDGAEFCAAFKNLYAIAIGWAAGTGARGATGAGGAPTVNLKATLFAQALLEMGYLVEVFGGVDKTALGPAGAGDLYVTCEAGRNGRLGRHMGSGLSFADVVEGPMRGETVEGAELAHRVAPLIRGLIEDGRIEAARVPLLSCILGEICSGPRRDIGLAEILGVCETPSRTRP
ncbi:MAG: glycerol-3-phosphate dehydrogenase [Pseudomonadota bacterium]